MKTISKMLMAGTVVKACDNGQSRTVVLTEPLVVHVNGESPSVAPTYLQDAYVAFNKANIYGKSRKGTVIVPVATFKAAQVYVPVAKADKPVVSAADLL